MPPRPSSTRPSTNHLHRPSHASATAIDSHVNPFAPPSKQIPNVDATINSSASLFDSSLPSNPLLSADFNDLVGSFANANQSMAGAAVQTKYGQITPPEDNWKVDWENNSEPMTFPPEPSDDFHGRSSRSNSGGSSPMPGPTSGGRVDKRDKYREKNRVAAAKCRAKKKEHVDGLEENHRTQSMLNSLLKQTEQNLRDELSFWRTQALQHAFCECHAIQDYNMKKARALAANKDFGGGDILRRDSLACPSPSSKNPGVPFYPGPNDYESQPS